jgi:hypothetical protein
MCLDMKKEQVDDEFISEYAIRLLDGLNMFFEQNPKGTITKKEFIKSSKMMWKITEQIMKEQKKDNHGECNSYIG